MRKILISLVVLALLAMGVAAYTRVAPTVAAAAGVAEEAPQRQSSVTTNITQQPDPETDGTFVSMDLQAGFLLDPYLVRVLGGGATAASELDSACSGYVNTDPSAVLNWSGDSEHLTIFVYSDADPVLVVETPEGELVCSDDYDPSVLDPVVTLENPTAGSYQIHVGTYAEDQVILGFLVITELDIEEELADLDLMPLLDRREVPEVVPAEIVGESALLIAESPVFGYAYLEDGFETVEVPAAAGGDLPAFSVDPNCAGFVSAIPTYEFIWAGTGNEIGVFYEAQEDTSLAILTPEGELVCNDDAADGNLNPALTLSDPVVGEYSVYVGSNDPLSVVVGTLTVTADTALQPETLGLESE